MATGGNAADGFSAGIAGGGYGAGLDNFGTASVLSSTFSGNTIAAGAASRPPTVSEGGASVFNEAGGTLNLVNTFAANDATGSDVANLGALTGGHDLLVSATGLPAGFRALIVAPASATLGPLQGQRRPGADPGSAGREPGDRRRRQRPGPRHRRPWPRSPRWLGCRHRRIPANAPYLVTSAADNGPGTLRDAAANITRYVGSNQIVFAPSLAGKTITVSSEILLTTDLTIDASAAPGLVIGGLYNPATGASPAASSRSTRASTPRSGT